MPMEREITQLGNMLIWFGLCIASAIPVWLVANHGPGPLAGTLLPVPVFWAAFHLGGGERLIREAVFASGLAYFAILLSPILIWRPSTPRRVIRVVTFIGVLHAVLICLSWAIVIGSLYFVGFPID
jgi:hypothetical protein